LGETGVEQVLASRCARQKKEYARRIPASLPLKEKVQKLTRVRKEEGYMAAMKCEPGGGFLLVENHCPICAAATACKGFCSTELDLFQAVLGPRVTIERVEHIVAGDRRCAYRIRAKCD
jgi:predicted ArsR family transcriptional regulator